MSKDWFTRFIEVIERDGRDMKAISLEAGCGQNYVQQMIKNGKRPGVDRLLAILNVLGSASAMYVLTGYEAAPEDQEFLRIVAGLDANLKDDALRLFRSLKARSDTPTPPSGRRR